MTQDRVNELLESYRTIQARCSYLQLQVDILTEGLRRNEQSMVSDRVSLSQAISGMPHGTSVGDPVGNLALDLVMGKVTVFVEQIRKELADVYSELYQKKRILACVDVWMGGLSDRERLAVEMKAIDKKPWAEVVLGFREKGIGECSKHTVQRLYDRGMGKIYEAAK